MIKELSPPAGIMGSGPSSTETQTSEGIPEYDLEEGLQVLSKKINGQLETKEIVVVLIAGGSCSGKTTVIAERVKVKFDPNVRILSIDDYYHGKTFMEAQAECKKPINWDQPEAVNLDLLRDHLEKLKRGETIQKPVYDLESSEPTEIESFDPAQVILVEGLFALTGKLKKIGDIKVFIDIAPNVVFARRISRDLKRTGKKPGEIASYVSETVRPQYRRYVMPTRSNADLIINNSRYNPAVAK